MINVTYTFISGLVPDVLSLALTVYELKTNSLVTSQWWAGTRENLSSGFPTMRNSNQSAQLQLLDIEIMLVACPDMIVSNK